MSKYLNTKQKKSKQKKKRSFGWFLFGMFLYAAIFLGAAYFGLRYLWNYMEAYEASRPANTVAAYMKDLTTDYVCDQCLEGVTASIDTNIQSPEECREFLMAELESGINYAKKSAECTDTRQVYVLRAGTTVVGQFSIVANAPDEYGFTTWSLEKESFDMTYVLKDETISITVPDSCIVSVNGVVLDESYITVDNIHYEQIEDYYGDYELPCKVTYEAGPFLGEFQFHVTNENGEEVTFDENTDYSPYYLNCTEDETKALNDFTNAFVKRYVAFTGSNKNTRYDTYYALMKYVVSDSDIASRLKDAIEGLQFGQSKGDEVVSITTNLQMALENDRYLCDVTYEVDTTGREGVVRTTTSVRLYVVKTDSGLKLEAMSIY